MKAQPTYSGTDTDSDAPDISVRSVMAQKLQGLSVDELTHLQELVSSRLSHRSTTHQVAAQDAAQGATGGIDLQQLTIREQEVLTLVASGYTRPEVAKALNISRNTAATHIANIYRKLEIESIAEATMLAFRWGIVC